MMAMINFNVPRLPERMEYIKAGRRIKKICGDGEFTKKCNDLD